MPGNIPKCCSESHKGFSYFLETIWSLLNCKRWLSAFTCGGEGLGVSGTEIVVQAAFAYASHPAQFINRGKHGVQEQKRGTENLGSFNGYLFSCSALGLGPRDWWLCETGARSALASGRGRDVSCSPPLHCSSWKPTASQYAKMCWLQGWAGAN